MASKISCQPVNRLISRLFQGSPPRPSRANRNSKTYHDLTEHLVAAEGAQPLEDRMLLTYLDPDPNLGIFEEVGGAGVGAADLVQVNSTGADRVAGAIHDVLAHPTNPDILYAASVNGGIWRTTNATSANPTWVVQTDDMFTNMLDVEGNPIRVNQGLSFGAISFDLTDRIDATPFSSMVAATGLFSSFNQDGNDVAGDPEGGLPGQVFVTHDGGATWVNPGSVGLEGQNVIAIEMEFDSAIGDYVIIAAASEGSEGNAGGGLFRSIDGGATFSPIVNAVAGSTFNSSTGATNFFAMVADPTVANPAPGQRGRLYAAAQGTDAGLYRSDDFGITWNKIDTGAVAAAISSAATNGMELTVHPRSGRLYVGVLHNGQIGGTAASAQGVGGIFYASDADQNAPTWIGMDNPYVPVNITDITLIRNSPGAGQTGPQTPPNGVGPIQITAPNHQLASGDLVLIRNSADPNNVLNRRWTVTRVDDNIVALNGSGGLFFPATGGQIMRIETSVNAQVPVPEGNPQGQIHFSLGTDPVNANVVYFGLDQLATPNDVGGTPTHASLWRGDASLNSTDASRPNAVRNAASVNLNATAPQWDTLAGAISAEDPTAGTANNTDPHRGSRAITFDANRNLIQADDGGLFRRSSPLDNTGDWASLAGNLGTSEYHSVAYDTLSNVIIAGSVDNGTQQAPVPASGTTEFTIIHGSTIRQESIAFGMRTTAQLNGGSGADVGVGLITSGPLAGNSVRYDSFENLAAFQTRVYNAAGNQVGGVTTRALQTTDGTTIGRQTQTSIAVNALDATNVILGASNGVYESFNFGTTVDRASSAADNIQVTPSAAGAVAYGGRSSRTYGNNPFIIYAGDVNGNIWARNQSAGDFTPEVLSAGERVVDVEINPGEWTEAFAVTGSTVHRVMIDAFSDPPAFTSNVDITGNLTALLPPGSEIFSIEYINGSGTGVEGLVVGTSTGVYATTIKSLDAGRNFWFAFGSAMPDVDVRDMDYDAEDDVLILGTLGRGTWKLDDASLFFIPKVTLSVELVGATGPTAGPVEIQENGSDSAQVTATLSRPTDVDIDVRLGSSGNAIYTEPGETAGSGVLTDDYDRVTGFDSDTVIRIPAGSTTGTAIFTALQDLHGELDELIQVTATVDNSADAEILQPFATTTYSTPGSVALNDPALPGDPPAVTSSTINVPDGGVITDLDLTLNISHTQTANLSAVLTAPDGTQIVLFSSLAAGANINGAVFDDEAPASITTGLPPYNGRFRALEALDLLDGMDSAGDWILEVTDSTPGDTGTLNSWSLTITRATDPTSLPQIIIIDDDDAPSVTLMVDDPSFTTKTIDENPAGTAIITATIDAASGQDVTVILDITPLQTAQESDFFTNPVADATIDPTRPNLRQITIPAGSLTAQMTLTAVDDIVDEFPEDIEIDIFDVINGTETGDQQVVVTIVEDDPLPGVTLTVDDASLTSKTIQENPEGVATITATIDAVSEKDVTVLLNFAPLDTAQESDFVTNPSADPAIDPLIPTLRQIVIPAGSLSANLTLTAFNDSFDEFDEDIVVSIHNVTNGMETGEQEVVVTITDDDPEPGVTLTLDDASLTAKTIDENPAGVATITATIDALSEKDVTVFLDITPLLTAQDSDFFTTPGVHDPTMPNLRQITIPKGSLTAALTLTAVNDDVDEFDEDIQIEIANVTNGVETGTQQVVVTITEEDPLVNVTLTVDGTTSLEKTIDENPAGVATITATINTISEKDVTVILEINPLLEAKESDFVTAPAADATIDPLRPTLRQITIPAGSLSAELVLTAVDDLLDEFAEEILVDIDNVINGLEVDKQQVKVTIVDDDALPGVTLTVDDASMTAKTIDENPAGVAVITATIDALSEKPVVVVVDITSLLTGSEADFVTNPAATDPTQPNLRQIIIPVGSLTADLTFTAVNDSLDEFDEDFIVTIDDITNGVAGGSQQVTVTIVEDDPEPGVTLTVDGATTTAKLIGENPAGTATITATLDALSEKAVTVVLDITPLLTAQESDFTTNPLADGTIDPARPNLRQITIPVGSLTADLTLTAVNDALDEFDEDILIDIDSVTNGIEIGTQQVTVTITEEDPLPLVTLTVDGPTSTAKDITENPAGVATVTATIDAVSEKDVIVILEISPLLTAQESDFVTNPVANAAIDPTRPNLRQIVIPAGSLTADLTLTAVDDNVDEFPEDIVIDIDDVINGLETSVQQVVVTIIDDDPLANVTLTTDRSEVREAPSEVATITATLDLVSEKDITIVLANNVATTATDGADYVASPYTIFIPAGQLTATTTITTVTDNLTEFDEQLIVDIVDVTNGLEDGEQQVTITIIDEDPEADEVVGIFQEQGGASVTNGNVQNVGSNNRVTGAIQDVVTHPTNPDIIYVATVNGGIWKTENATDAFPIWVPQTDRLTSLSIGAIEFDLSDPTAQSLVAGTGQYSSFTSNGDEQSEGGLQGQIYVTDDGGANWIHPAAEGLEGQNVSGLFRSGDIIVVTSSEGTGGLFRSTDKGETFVPISGPDFVSDGSTNFFDIVPDLTEPGRLYAAAEDLGIYRSEDFGVNWVKVSGVDPTLGDNAALQAAITNSTNNLLKLSVHPATGRVYLGVVNSGRIAGIFYTSDGDTASPTWINMGVPATGGPLLNINESGAQGLIHFSIVTDPANHNLVYVGAGNTGSLFRGNVDPVPTWATITNAGTANNSRPNRDTGAVAIDANGNLIEVDAGGVFRRTNPQNSTGVWTTLAGNLGVVEYHSIAFDSVSNVILGGSNDHGTHVQESPGSSTFNRLSDTTGGDIAVDAVSLAGAGQSIRYTSSDFLGNFRAIVTDAGNNLVSSTTLPLSETDETILVPQYITPIVVNAVNPLQFVLGAANGVYETFNQGITVDNAGPGIRTSDAFAGALAYGGRSVVNGDNEFVIYAGDDNGAVHVRTLSAGTFLSSGPLGGPIRDIAMDPNEWMTAFAINETSVWMTNDAGVSWTDITANLHLTGAGEIYSLEYMNGAVNGLVIGTDRGVFATTFDHLGTWFRFGSGLPDVQVRDMDYDATDDVLVLGTLGRGAWRMDNASTFLMPNVVLSTNTLTLPEDGSRSATITARLSRVNPDADVIVNIGSAGTATFTEPTGTGAYSDDYTRSLGQIVIPAGELLGSLTITALQDVFDEDDEVIRVVATSVTEAQVYVRTNELTSTQTFTNSTPQAILDFTPVDSTVDVVVPGYVTDVNVQIDIAHTQTSDIAAFLIAPDGTEVLLIGGVGGGADFAGTTLDDEAGTDIAFGANPFSGSFRPAQALSTFDSLSATGTWTLQIIDLATGEIGTLNSWSLTIGHVLEPNILPEITIIDDDETPLVRLVRAPATINEDGTLGNAIITAELYDPITLLATNSGRDVTVDLVVNAGSTAGFGTDYSLSALQIVIPRDTPSASVTLTPLQDSFDEFDEDVVIDIAGTTNAVEDGIQQVIVTIVDDDPEPNVTLSVNGGATLQAIAETGGVAVITATIDAVSEKDVTVTLEVDTDNSTATATAPVDFTTTSLSILIPAGSTTGTIFLNSVSDLLDEFNETAIINIVETINSVEATEQSVTVIIVDDDPLPTVRLTVNGGATAQTILENPSQVATVTATINAVSEKDVVVALTINGLSSAVSGEDFDESALTISIPAGSTTGTITITSLNDSFDEFDETVIIDVVAAGVVNAQEATPQSVTVTIVDDDAEPGVVLTVDTTSITEGPVRTATFTARLDAISEKDVTVDLAISGTATGGGNDYTGPATSIVIPAGLLSASTQITSVDNMIYEGDETVIVDIANVTNGVETGVQRQTVTIIEDDERPVVTLSVTSTVVSENGGSVLVIATIDAVSDLDVVVDFSFAGVAQGGGIDYQAPPSTITIPAGSLDASIIIEAVPDVIDEPNETVDVGIAAASNAIIGSPSTVTTTIQDDDLPALVTLTGPVGGIAENGGTGVFTATLNTVSGRDITVNLGVVGSSTATGGGVDYNDPGLTIFIPAGTLSGTTTFTAVDDIVDEFNETLILEIVSVDAGAENLIQQATATIIDDDALPNVTLAVSSANVTEAPQTAQITVSIDAVSERNVTVDLVLNGTATGGSVDFTDPQLRLVIPAGQLSATTSLTTVQDEFSETNETIIVDIAGVINGAESGVQQQTITILDDDVPTLTLAVVASLINEIDGPAATVATVTRNTDTSVALTVDITSSDPTEATAPLQVFIPVGASSASFLIAAVNDLILDGPQSVDFTASAAGFVSATDGLTVMDSTTAVGLTVSTNAATESDQTVITITVNADAPVIGNQTVGLAVSGTGISPADYTLSSSTLSILNGQTTATATLTINDDSLVELITENLQLALVNPSIGLALSGVTTQQISIADNDQATIAINSVSRTEGSTGSSGFVFTLTLDNEVDTDLLFEVSTVDGTATASDNDFNPVTAASLGFMAGQGAGPFTRTIAIQVAGDTKVELDEAFSVELSNLVAAGRNVTFANTTGVASILNDDSASITVADLSASEGDSGSTTFNFEVTLNAEIAAEVTVDFSTIAGTASNATNDFVAVNGALVTFAANTGGPQVQTVSVQVTGDQQVELNEDFLVELSNLANAALNVAIADAQATGTIVNDDSASISVADVSVTEGDAGVSTVVFTVTLDKAVDSPLTVDYSVVGDTAVAGVDFVALSGGTLSFSGTAGETHTVQVEVTGDITVEQDETFFLNLANLVAGSLDVSISDAQGVATITNDDTAELSISDVTAIETDSGVTSVIFEVVMTGQVDTPVIIGFDTADGTAIAAEDYLSGSGSLRFNPTTGTTGQTRTFAVQIIGDRKVELDESFSVNLSGLQAGGRNVTVTDDQSVVTITNDDVATVSIADVAVVEGDSGTATMSFVVTLNSEVDRDITVDFASLAGTATAADYEADVSGTLTFVANSGGTQTLPVTLNINGDTLAEANESILVDLSNLLTSGLSVTLADNQAIGTIQNDDSVFVSVSDATVDEGDSGTSVATFTVTMTGDNSLPVVINLNTGSSTAVGNQDYTPISGGSVTFAPGSGTQTQTFAVTIIGDQKVELDEAFTVSLTDEGSSGLNVIFDDALALGTITNDDAAQFSIADISVNEGISGNTQFVFTVTLDAEIDAAVSIDYSTLDQTATVADGDYVAGSGSLQFAANTGGPQTRTLAVRATGDRTVELDEAFLVQLSNISATGRDITLLDADGLGNILNDDSAVITISDASIQEGSLGSSQLIFSVVLEGNVDAPILVDATAEEGTALAGFDFQLGGTQSFTFDADGGNRQARTFSVPVVGDNVVELDESFLVNLTNLVSLGRNVTIADGTANGTIVNDDTANLNVSNVQILEGNGTSRDVIFTASLDAAVDTGFTVDYATSDGSATVADGDYNAASGNLSFSGLAGEARTFSVRVNGDSTVELNETFSVGLLNLSASGRNINLSTGQSTVTITNDDAASISISDVAMVEGQSGTTAFNFVVTLNGDVDGPVSVSYATEDGTATSGSGDYVAIASGTLDFAGTAGETRTITVLVNGDGLVEDEESFSVRLFDLATVGRNVTLADDRGIGSITNEDTVLVTISDATVVEGNFPDSSFLTFVVTRSNTSIPIDINFTSIDGTATAASGDYRPVNGVLNFPVDSPTTANVVIEVLGDHLAELDETVFVELSTSTRGVVISDTRAQGTILHDDGFVSGQKWLDLDGDGNQDSNEPGLNGWVIQIVNSRGVVVTQGTTGSVDLNNDGTINPITEQGLYTIPVGSGSWFVQEVLPTGWQQTSPNGGDALAYQLDQQLGLRTSGSQFINWGGLNEKWVFGTEGWYYITPAGNLFEWDGSPRSNLSGSFVAALGSRFYDTPSLLTNAQESGQVAVTVTTGQTVSDINFGNRPTGSISGRKWHDVNADGRRGINETWLNGWTIDLTDANGNIVGTAVTSDLDLNNDGQIDLTTETGWYRFENLMPGSYTVSERNQPLWSQVGSNGLFTNEAFELNEERQFRTPQTDFLNWGGRQEKWLWGRGFGWHFITPDGSIYQWDQSPRTALTGTLITTLNSSFYNDLSLLFNPAQPSVHQVTVSGQEVTGVNFGNSFGHDGTGAGNVAVNITGSTASITGDALDNSVAIYKDVFGNTLITGVGGTTLNGLVSPIVLVGDATTINVSLGAGNDQLVAYGLTMGSNMTVNTETGADRVTIGEVSAGAISIVNSGGNDSHRLIDVNAGSLSINGGGQAAVENSAIAGNLNVTASGASAVVIHNSSVAGSSTIQTAGGADAFIANRSIFNGFTANTGASNDIIAFYENTFRGAVNVNSGNGNDTIGTRNSNRFQAAATINGGRDSDTFASDGSGSTAVLEAVENEDNSTLDGLIDAVLGNFNDLSLDI